MSLAWVKNFRRRRSIKRKDIQIRKIISDSGLFDEKWYIENYPDIRSTELTPLEHYVEYGAAEYRSASPLFDTEAYLIANPDVAAARENPLVHYIRHGINEGRGFAHQSRTRPRLSRVNLPGSERPTFSLIILDDPGGNISATLESISYVVFHSFEVVLDENIAGWQILRDRYLSRRKDIDVFSVAPATHGHPIQPFIRSAKNNFIIVIRSGDILYSNSLRSLSLLIEQTACDLAYADEIQSRSGMKEPEIVLKPSWSPELLTAFNYFGRPTAIDRSLALAALPLSSGDDPVLSVAAAEWDLNLRAAKHARRIERFPAVLCHRSTAGAHDTRIASPQQTDLALVLQNHWKRLGHDAKVAQNADGTFRSSWTSVRPPLVSIIVPNKNSFTLLTTCIFGLTNKTNYKNIEIIIVDNGSTETNTVNFYNEIKSYAINIIKYNEEFNYSRACNLGASAARGDLLLFLNNDIEVIESNWLDELVRQACEPGVGVVGAKLLYPGGGIQHAGVVLGLSSLAAHVFHGADENTWGPLGSPQVQRNWLAVTGACQLVRKTLFDLVGGYDERFQLIYSDVVFCLDVARMGFRTVYQSSAILIHHEGASRAGTDPWDDEVLFAKVIREHGIASDPYFHPNLDAQSREPKLKSEPSSTGRAPLPITIERIAGSPAKPLDLYDVGAVASSCGMEWDDVLWAFDPSQMKPGLQAGTQIVLAFLLYRRDFRRRFPTALKDGAQGRFAAWIKTEGLRLLGLDDDYVGWIDAAFEADPGAASRQLLFYDEALKKDYPLFLLSAGRDITCQRLFDAVRGGHLTLEGAWWFLLANAESPQDALCQTWATTPSWQERFPDGGTVFGITGLAQWVGDTFGAQDDGIYVQDYPTHLSDAAQVRLAYANHPDWKDRFPDALSNEVAALSLLEYLATREAGLSFLPRRWVAEKQGGPLARDLVQPGINILAHFSYPSGLRSSSESIVEGLRHNAIGVSLRDVPVSVETDSPIGHRFQGVEIFDTTLIHIQPQPMFHDVYERAGLRARGKPTYRIGYWYWELDEIPSSWNRASLECDEIWTATDFIADGLRQRFRQPIHVLNPGVEIGAFDRQPRSSFAFAEDDFVFCFVFHMASIMERKNPLGLIRAFKLAFPSEQSAKLVIKTSFGHQFPDAMRVLRDAAVSANIEIIDQIFTRDRTLSLISACDAYVSLHRSEGFGLTMAEAMLLEKPVIATGYSGNLEFMSETNSLLVQHRLVTLDRDYDPYKAGQRWAEPSVEHAAQLMRRLFDERGFAKELGAFAKVDLERRLNHRDTGRAIAGRLIEIDRMK